MHYLSFSASVQARLMPTMSFEQEPRSGRNLFLRNVVLAFGAGRRHIVEFLESFKCVPTLWAGVFVNWHRCHLKNCAGTP